MGYLHINNLYNDQTVMMFKRCYALEKIHGTSAHIKHKDGNITYFSGGAKHESFVEIFNQDEIKAHFEELAVPDVCIFGEAYGGKMHGMKETYGDQLKFVAFDVQINGLWLDVPKAEKIARGFGLEFVDYERTTTDLEELNRVRDLDSTQAMRNGMGAGKKREGVVLRPLEEFTRNNGGRVIAKHKREDFSEVKTPRVVGDKFELLVESQKIADEYVTPMRLNHVLDKMQITKLSPKFMGDIIVAMVADVKREGFGEFEETKQALSAIGKATALMVKDRMKKDLEAQ